MGQPAGVGSRSVTRFGVVCAWVAVVMASGCVKLSKTEPDNVYVHKVKAGESLASIADEYYGDRTRADVIAKFNDLDGESIEPDTVLRIPMTGEDEARRQTREKALVHYNEGLAMVDGGAYVDAVARFRQATTIDPDFADAYYNLGVTLNKIKAYDRAADELERACRLDPAPPGYHFALGNSYFYLERYEKAARCFEMVLERNPKHVKAIYSLAMSREKLGDTAGAKAAWKRYLEIDSSGPWAAEARKRLQNLP